MRNAPYGGHALAVRIAAPAPRVDAPASRVEKPADAKVKSLALELAAARADRDNLTAAFDTAYEFM